MLRILAEKSYRVIFPSLAGVNQEQTSPKKREQKTQTEKKQKKTLMGIIGHLIHQLKPGMRAKAHITIQSETFLAMLLRQTKVENDNLHYF